MLCAYNVKTKQVRTVFEDPKGNVRDPQIHYDAEKLVFAYLPKGKRHYSLYEINLDGTGLRQLTGQGENGGGRHTSRASIAASPHDE